MFVTAINTQVFVFQLFTQRSFYFALIAEESEKAYERWPTKMLHVPRNEPNVWYECCKPNANTCWAIDVYLECFRRLKAFSWLCVRT